jgi:hypothetical protein
VKPLVLAFELLLGLFECCEARENDIVGGTGTVDAVLTQVFLDADGALVCCYHAVL